MIKNAPLPVVVIGAGPVGVAAAAHLLERGLRPLVLEAGDRIGHSIRQWAHVRMFSPWRYMIDPACRRLLETRGWTAPEEDELPTGGELVQRYLEPLADVPGLREAIRLRSRVTAVSRERMDKVKTPEREQTPFVVRYVDADGREHDVKAQAVIDASGTWEHPNPIGANGLPARGEAGVRERIHYGIPDVLGSQKDRYSGKRVLVAGSGHSAINSLLGLVQLAEEHPETRVFWGIRRAAPAHAYGGAAADALPARGALGQRLKAEVESGRVTLLTGLQIGELRPRNGEVKVIDVQRGAIATVDQLVVATGMRPNLEMLRELRLELDPILESPRALGPMIDPNVHSCGTVRPHGAFELTQPEPNFFIVGMKSYGRAPTFLLATGYEQVRSVVAYLVGDMEAARDVQLNLPETGVCSTNLSDGDAIGRGCCGSGDASHAGSAKAGEPTAEADRAAKPADEPSPVAATEGGCCGGPAPAGTDACCVQDAEAKASGESGCGCGSSGSKDEASQGHPRQAQPALTTAGAGSCCG